MLNKVVIVGYLDYLKETDTALYIQLKGEEGFRNPFGNFDRTTITIPVKVTSKYVMNKILSNQDMYSHGTILSVEGILSGMPRDKSHSMHIVVQVGGNIEIYSNRVPNGISRSFFDGKFTGRNTYETSQKTTQPVNDTKSVNGKTDTKQTIEPTSMEDEIPF